MDAGKQARPRTTRNETQLKSAEIKFGNLAFENDYMNKNERRRYWKLLSDQEGNSIKKYAKKKQTNNIKQQRPGIKHKRKKKQPNNTRSSSTHLLTNTQTLN